MVRLIVCDVDGTILKKNRKLDEGYFSLIKKLKKKGILFAVASGRPYHFLRKLFAPSLDDVFFICHDGAALIFRDTLLYREPLPQKAVARVLSEQGDQNLLLLCKDRSYYKTGSGLFFSEVDKTFGEDAIRIEDLSAVGEPIYKIALYGFHSGIGPCEDYGIPYHGNGWCELAAPNVDKKTALDELLRVHNIDYADVMAFGDGENDVPMLDAVGTPYIMFNAKQRLLSRYERRTGSVLYTIQKEILNAK